MKKNSLVLVTGGAGFIGRWVVKALLSDTSYRVAVIDDLSNGCMENLEEFGREPRFSEFIHAGVESSKRLETVFSRMKPSLCLHLAARIVVQSSIDDPSGTFRADVQGTFRLLELCRKNLTPMLFMSTCMVYDLASARGSISEKHPVLPRSPYAGAKLAAEHLAISYYHAYGMPVSVVRPFNTYGPHQKSSGEGGVISIFLNRMLSGLDMNIYGTGEQTRDFLYVEDCADFILRVAASEQARGIVLNAGTGRDVTINQLAGIVASMRGEGRRIKVKHVKHIHPQSEIMKLKCNPAMAARLLGWKPRVRFEKGLALTAGWIGHNIEKGIKAWT